MLFFAHNIFRSHLWCNLNAEEEPGELLAALCHLQNNNVLCYNTEHVRRVFGSREMRKTMNEPDKKKHDFVQVKNPRTDRYIKIDRTVGIIVSSKTTPGPYKGIPIARKS